MASGEGLHPSAAAVAVVLDEMAPGAEVRQLDSSTRSAAEAAAALGCYVCAIASRLVFMAVDGPVLIMTSGAHRVDLDLVAAEAGLAGLRKATAGEVRAATGQAIGGVAPVGHRPSRQLREARGSTVAHGTARLVAGLRDWVHGRLGRGHVDRGG